MVLRGTVVEKPRRGFFAENIEDGCWSTGQFESRIDLNSNNTTTMTTTTTTTTTALVGLRGGCGPGSA
ncbi:hypothetical protein K0M31_006395 [Melipona bicolor]|uniref:Uncharacterized protein n=1 Tax=Melipona bicolor TaxID=60889 RepID=A0AA40FUE7_9HYME|nr:hypothetical protein K0M31_006395 [Melipona bicolor]